MAHETVIRPRLVVGNDEDDVGWLGGAGVAGKRQDGGQEQECAFHAEVNM